MVNGEWSMVNGEPACRQVVNKEQVHILNTVVVACHSKSKFFLRDRHCGKTI
jgi:hypothetical protein